MTDAAQVHGLLTKGLTYIVDRDMPWLLAKVEYPYSHQTVFYIKKGVAEGDTREAEQENMRYYLSRNNIAKPTQKDFVLASIGSPRDVVIDVLEYLAKKTAAIIQTMDKLGLETAFDARSVDNSEVAISNWLMKTARYNDRYGFLRHPITKSLYSFRFVGEEVVGLVHDNDGPLSHGVQAFVGHTTIEKGLRTYCDHLAGQIVNIPAQYRDMVDRVENSTPQQDQTLPDPDVIRWLSSQARIETKSARAVAHLSCPIENIDYEITAPRDSHSVTIAADDNLISIRDSTLEAEIFATARTIEDIVSQDLKRSAALAASIAST